MYLIVLAGIQQNLIAPMLADETYAFPASFAQQRLWIVDQLARHSGAYNMPFAYRLRGPLSVAALCAALQALVERADAASGGDWLLDEASLTLGPALPNPGKIICVGLNYHDHVQETGRTVTENPVLFARYAGSQVGHGAPLVKPLESDDFDYEGELAVIIGKGGRRIALRPEARVTHYGGRSRRQGRASVMAPRVRGLLRYLRKHEGAARSAAFEVAFRPLFAAGILADAASAGCKAAFYRARRGKERKAARMKEVFDAYCLFIRRDLFPFLLSLWE